MYIAIKSAMESSQALQIAQQSFGKCSAYTFMAYSPTFNLQVQIFIQTGLCFNSWSITYTQRKMDDMQKVNESYMWRLHMSAYGQYVK